MLKYFVIRNFRDTCSSVEMLKGYMLLCRNAEGVHGQRNVGKPCPRAIKVCTLDYLNQFFICCYWICYGSGLIAACNCQSLARAA